MPHVLLPAVLRPARAISTLIAAAGAAILVACAPKTTAPAPIAVDQVRALEQRFAQDSTNVGLRIRLAAAYRSGDRFEEARRLLEPVVRADPLAAYHLALVNEDLRRWAAARTLYQDYLQRGRDSRLQETVRSRLALVQRLELEEAVRSALTRERELAGTTPAPRTVGVFPFLLATTDTTLRPLGTAMAELLTTDLAQTERLRVLERVRVQMLLDEMKLGASGRVDVSTAARSGRILGASNVVQGRVDGSQTQLALQTSVVRVPSPTGTPLTPIRSSGALARIFELEKNLALALYERMGVQLTVAERQRVMRQQTRNVQALLAFGFGLEAEDAGRFGESYAHFQRAVQLDPNFARAREKMDESSRLGLAASLSVDVLANMALAPETTPATAGATPGNRNASAASAVRLQRLLDFRTIELLMSSPLMRDPAAEVVGTEGAIRSGRAEIVIRRPGSQP
jgi:tetratricopeptide (TPR) repeat protein